MLVFANGAVTLCVQLCALKSSQTPSPPSPLPPVLALAFPPPPGPFPDELGPATTCSCSVFRFLPPPGTSISSGSSKSESVSSSEELNSSWTRFWKRDTVRTHLHYVAKCLSSSSSPFGPWRPCSSGVLKDVLCAPSSLLRPRGVCVTGARPTQAFITLFPGNVSLLATTPSPLPMILSAAPSLLLPKSPTNLFSCAKISFRLLVARRQNAFVFFVSVTSLEMSNLQKKLFRNETK